MSGGGSNQLCPAVPSVLTKTKSIPGYEDAPGRGKNHECGEAAEENLHWKHLSSSLKS